MEDIAARSLTDFLRNHREHVERLRETGTPEALTINSRPELVVQSAEAYQTTLHRLDHAENVVGLYQAYGQFRTGKTRDFLAGVRRYRRAMAFSFLLTERAWSDLESIIADLLPSVAAKWLDGLDGTVAAFSDGSPAPESKDTDFETRQIEYRSHRILFVVEEGVVGILRVYRGARQRLTMNLLQS